RQVADAIESVTRLRRCSARMGRRGRRKEGLCTAAQLGVAACPCTGDLTELEYAAVVDDVIRGLTDEPRRLLDRLEERMYELASTERFEEAADTRDRAAALARVLDRQRRLDALRGTGWLQLQLPGGVIATLERGVLTDVRSHDDAATLPLPSDLEIPSEHGPLPRHLADEMACAAAWLADHAHRIGLVECSGGWALPAVPLPMFTPTR
ncbi:MAG: UvrB/UvrC motif-containing protein, partial [Acidimicrobiia bacterium]